jgi:DNA-binding transcriptional ArsR family regulator
MSASWHLQEFKADLFRTMANPVRIRILEEIREAGAPTVSEIQQAVGIEPSNASQHLSVLRSRGVVQATREGNTIRYSVADPEVFALLDTARRVFEKRLQSQQQALQ